MYNGIPRASTPTHRFILPIDFEQDGDTLLITYDQLGRIVFEKTQEDCTIVGSEVLTRLTQEETKMFYPKEIVEIQLRAKTKDGSVYNSQIIKRSVADVLNDKVL